MRRNKKNVVIFLLIIVVLLITLGYSYINSDLSINGTMNVSDASWHVYWDNVVLSSNNVSDVTANATLSGDTEVTFNINFKEPGDTYEFTVDAVNDGSIGAMIDVITKGVYELDGTTQKELPSYLEYSVTYVDGIEIGKNHILAAGQRETYRVRVHYKEDIEATDLPQTVDSFRFKFRVTYKQADNSAVEKPSYVYTVNKYDENITEPKYNAVWLSQAFPTAITKYNTPSEALSAIATASSKDLPFYLKQKLENGIVTESYVEFVVTDEMATANSGMVPGTYTLRGERTYDIDTEAYLVDENYISTYYEANKEAIKEAFGYSTNPSRCSESGTGRSSTFRCSVSGLNAGAIAFGSVFANDTDSSDCNVSSDGFSYCNW